MCKNLSIDLLRQCCPSAKGDRLLLFENWRAPGYYVRTQCININIAEPDDFPASEQRVINK